MRFTPEQLKRSDELAQQYVALDAETTASWAEGTWAEREPESDGSFLSRLRAAGREVPQFDWTNLYVGRGLDKEFVAFMNVIRRRIASILLDKSRRENLLVPILDRFDIEDEVSESELASDGHPQLKDIASLKELRDRLIATVDTVLLRLVLYRYLEAQYGYEPTDEERQEIAFGSYDELIKQTTRADDQRLQELLGRARKEAGIQAGQPTSEQRKLFEDAMQVKQPEAFEDGIRERHGYHRALAGGDLHQGEISRAADALQDYLLENCREDLATLIEGTRSDRYSFHYADLDPRAFQQFYEDTIGTEIRPRYNPETENIEVGVEEWSKNQKEQGAFYTDKKIAEWLASRTLGSRLDNWYDRLLDFLDAEAKEPKGRLPKLRRLLDELLNVRVLDFTCGGGIFLRAAFERLVQEQQRVAEALETHLPKEVYRTLTEGAPYDLFGPSVETGRWEWHVLLHCLYGVDLDVKAINVASNLLTLSALTYKPHGVSFPSFINTNLKVGNAFVVPLTPERRENLSEVYQEEIQRLIALRKKLRDPELSRDRWRDLNEEASSITREITNSQIVLAFDEVFPDLPDEEVIRRVREVGCFLYEIEFPEAYFYEDGTWKDNQGFDVILGNPPWEVPAKELNHFLPEFDTEYRLLSGPDSKKREEELLSDPEIARRWKRYQRSVDDFKKLLGAQYYEHQVGEVKGRKVPGEKNLYKYATELAFRQTVENGRIGMVLEAGLWLDVSAKGPRKLLLDNTDLSAVCGFNNKGIFSGVDDRTRFTCTVAQKGRSTDVLPVIFMREEVEALERFDEEKVEIPASKVRKHPSDAYLLMSVRSEEHWNAVGPLKNHPRLEDEPWLVDIYTRELHENDQRDKFKNKPADIPVLKGAQFNIWGVFEGDKPEYWIDMDGENEAGSFLRRRQWKRLKNKSAKKINEEGYHIKGSSNIDLFINWVEAVTGERILKEWSYTDKWKALPKEWRKLDLDGYRVAWRDGTNMTNKRTLVPAVVPRRVALTHTAPFIRPFKLTVKKEKVEWELRYSHECLLYLTGILSSYAADSKAKGEVGKSHLTSGIFKGLHVPKWTGSERQRRIAELCAMLTCLPATEERPWADYIDLGKAVGVDPETDALTGAEERREAEVELNALANKEYGLDREGFEFLIGELFDTPEHREEHFSMRDHIVREM
ncbi:hypothetical protein GGP62_003058 [Salinibacter ruber]|uniref:Eco57I restriction-modification methylase domain-containing protein n=1 Tax=Salinibacter ruber TaxID=146919 RepID=UPI00216780EE|nr:hypothetical protein [Salinibacter ruber]